MKRIMMLFTAAFAAVCFGAQIVSQMPGDTDEFIKTSVTTNLVMAYEIVELKWEPCECPDGLSGCLVLHMNKVERKKYVPIEIEERVEVDKCEYVPIIRKGACIWMHAADCKCLREHHHRVKDRDNHD